MNKRILGLDLSLTATGWALVWDGSPKWGVIKSKHRSAKRLSEIRNEVRVIIYQEQPSLAVIEGYSYGSHQGMAGLAELGGVVRLLLLDMGVPFIVVQPTTNKKFATGKDAFALAQFGRCYLNPEGFCDYQVASVETYKRKELGK